MFSRISGQIFAVDWGGGEFNAFFHSNLREYRYHKLYIVEN